MPCGMILHYNSVCETGPQCHIGACMRAHFTMYLSTDTVDLYQSQIAVMN